MSRPVKRATFVESDPAWEARKASRRAVGHHAAVLESAEITRVQWRIMNKPEAARIDLRRILRTLTAKKIRFVLTGAHAIGGWTGRPRATKDVDILVKGGRTHARAVKVLRELYPHLEVRDFFGVTGFFLPGETDSVIDVTYPHRADITETLEHPQWVEDGDLKYRIPSLEAALANKYGAMLTLNRDLVKRGMDAIDFTLMVRHAGDPGQTPIDIDKLRLLGEKVWPGGGAAEILRLVEHVWQGGMVELRNLLGEA
jgi:hypothetical protein